MYGELLKVATPQEVLNRWDKRIAFLQEHVEYLNDWEQSFVTSLEERRIYCHELSSKQVSKLYEIFNRIDWKLG